MLINYVQKAKQSTEVTKIPPTTSVEAADDAPVSGKREIESDDETGSNGLKSVMSSAQIRPPSRY